MSPAPTQHQEPHDADVELFPTSYAQQRMWFFHHLDPGNPYYNIPLVLRLSGTVDPAALGAALNSVVDRHEILRTTFAEADGEPLQRIAAHRAIELEAAGPLPAPADGGALSGPALQWALDWVNRPFDLGEGPLIRAALATPGPGGDEHLLLLCLHHIVTDGWSLNILARELAAYYREHVTGEPAELAPLDIQYADFAEWQLDRLRGEELERQLAYWRARLGGDLPVLRMPADRPRPAVQSFRGGRVDFDVPDELTAALRACGRRHGATLFMTLLSGVAALLHRYSGQDDIVLGSPTAGRDQVETEPLMGLFVNTLPLRSDLSGDPSFAELLSRTAAMCGGAYGHQEVPLDKLVEDLQPERDPGRNPLFQVMFALQNRADLDLALPGAQLRAVALPRPSTRFDLEFHLWEDGERMTGAVAYSTDLFDRETVTRMTGRLIRLLDAAVRSPGTPVADLPLLDAEEAAEPAAHAPAAAVDPTATVPAAFAAQALRTPEATAVATPDGARVAYSELADRASVLASGLHGLGVRPGQRIGLRLARGADSVAAALAVLALGAVCVPVDVRLPAAVARQWIADAEVRTLLADAPGPAPAGVEVIALPLPEAAVLPEAAAGSPSAGQDGGPRGEDPAFVVRSAGGPVPYRHADLCDSVRWLQELGGLGADDVVPHAAPAELITAVHELLWPLLTGAAVRPCAPGQYAAGDTVALLPPAALASPGLLAARPRLVLVEGGRLGVEAADRFHAACPAAELHLLRAAPEAGGYLTAQRCRPELADFAAGRIANRTVAVRDERGNPLPVGVPGRLHAGRPGTDPAPTSWHGRLLADGRLAVDEDDESGPVRLGGYEASRAGIESALLADASVGACAVAPRTDADGVERLVAYTVPAGAFSAGRLRARAGQTLPAALVPDAFVAVSTLPRTRGGRVHTAALTALPVLDEDLAGRWERQLAETHGPGRVAVVVEEDPGPRHEERVHVGALGAGPAEQRAPRGAGSDADGRPGGGRLALAVGPDAPDPGVRTLTDALLRAAARDEGGVLHLGREDDGELAVGYRALADEASRVLGGLRRLGLVPGDKAVLQCPDNHDFMVAFWACVLGGFVPVPLAPAPTYAEDNAHVERLAGALELLGDPIVLTGGATAGALRALGARRGWQGPRLGVLDELRTGEPDLDPHPASPDDVALLLLTSGSTGRPKAVVQRHRNVLARCAGTCAANGFGAHDVTFNWMPLDHVGGVVMFHVRDVFLGALQVHAPTAWVLRDPLRWLEAVHRFRVSLTWAPNFAFGLVNDRAAEALGRGWDLSCLRFVQNAGEAIMPRVARRFLTALSPLGLPGTAMRPSWGMSETCSAVTYSDAFTLESTSDEDGFTDVGRPIPGTSLRIVDDAGETVPEGVPGRLLVRGPTVTSGYYENEEQNRESFAMGDGWFETGDLGVLRDGSLTITGRAKDVLIVNGVNHYCHEIESAVEELDCVENSWTAACAVREAHAMTDGLVLFFHPRPGTDPAGAAREVRSQLVRKLGLNPRHVLPVEREDIPKTEIGKIQRSRLRERFESGGFDEATARVDLLLGNERTVPNWFHERVWRPARALPAAPAPADAPVLVFADSGALADLLVAELAARGRDAVRVDPGEEFAKVGAGRYRLRAESARDCELLLDALADEGASVREIVHLASCAPPAPSDRVLPADAAGLVRLVQALAARRTDEHEVTLRVVGRHTQQVSPDEVLDPDRAVLLGLVASLAQELPWLRCSHLDLEDAPATREEASLVLAELAARRGEPEAAVRGGARLVPRLAALPTAAGGRAADPFREGGFYTVTGGLGGLGAEVCGHLLDAYGARLLVVGRTELPPEAEWESRIAEGGVLGRRLEVYRDLRARRGEVRYEAVDVCDEERVREAVRQAGKHWSAELSGVLHLAGVFRQRPFLDQTPEELAEVLAPKTAGARALLGALEDAPPGALFVAFSSVNGALGGAMASAYAAANGYLDAVARNRHRTAGGGAHSLAWSLWDETGMSRGLGLAGPSRARGYLPIGRAEGLRSFVHALRRGRPHVLIGLDPAKPSIRGLLDAPVRPLEKLVAYSESADGREGAGLVDRHGLVDRYGVAVPWETVALGALPRTADGSLDRAALLDTSRAGDGEGGGAATAESGPAGETQRLIASVWREVLQVDRVGPRQNFFDLGGHSLQMARVHGLLETALGRRFSMVDLFLHPTVTALAAHLEGDGNGDEPGTAAAPAGARGRERAERRQAARARRRGR
ncbi:SDR family NAD(P)-dependent oxidoreductase [Streptomyces sp. NPDC051907]|uniref:SDR family NAD(P)-dependent oxidoreductase n=1 Tax=Streptomyces sp. NPDC051907 TaxID=3155284 RepID=UPI003418F65B